MNEKKNQTAQDEVNAIPVPVKPRNEWVHCSKCGAALKAQNGGSAYICPVCGTLFRLRLGTKIVQNIPVKEKEVFFSVTEKAVKSIVKNEKQAKKKAKPLSPRKQKKEQKKLQRALETLLSQNDRLKDYEEGEVFAIDVDETGKVSVKKTNAKA